MDDNFILSEKLEYNNNYEGFLVTKVNPDHKGLSEEGKFSVINKSQKNFP